MAYRCAALDLWLPRRDLLVSLLLIIAAQTAHRRSGNQFTDVGQKALAIIMTPVGPECESGVPQAAKIAHRLAIGWPAKLGLPLNCFFQLGVRDLAVRLGCGGPERAEENDREKNFHRFHICIHLVKSGGGAATRAASILCSNGRRRERA